MSCDPYHYSTLYFYASSCLEVLNPFQCCMPAQVPVTPKSPAFRKIRMYRDISTTTNEESEQEPEPTIESPVHNLPVVTDLPVPYDEPMSLVYEPSINTVVIDMPSYPENVITSDVFLNLEPDQTIEIVAENGVTIEGASDSSYDYCESDNMISMV